MALPWLRPWLFFALALWAAFWSLYAASGGQAGTLLRRVAGKM